MWYRNLDLADTIFALATGKPPSAVAIVRLSGPQTFSIAEKLFRGGSDEFLRNRGMYFGELVDELGTALDRILLLSFVGPHSFTGEDVVEFHCHGTEVIVHRLAQALTKLGARPAQPGEFAYRAYSHDKMSPAELETLGDIFRAQNFGDLSHIYARRDGSMERFVGHLRDGLLSLQAILDTAVDFSDEYSEVIHQARNPMNGIIRECSAAIQRYSQFRDPCSVPRIVIAGRPNVGKSSLFNALIGRYRAIVHGEPGTTRDVVEEDIEISGRRWKLADTAGIRETENLAERQGLSLGENFLKGATAWLLVVDGTEGIGPQERGLLERFGSVPHRVVWNKGDLASRLPPIPTALSVSALTGEGLDKLWESIDDILPSGGEENLPLPTLTQQGVLGRVVEELQCLERELDSGVVPEVLGERNRRILNLVEDLTGPVDTESILDRVFGEFCIGK